MTEVLWIPPGAAVGRSAALPDGPLYWPDGRVLQQVPVPLPSPSAREERMWASRHFTVIAGVETTPHGELIHASIARRDRDPSWDEIKQLREVMFPEQVDVMMVLPIEDDYLNVHEHCFHLWQVPVRWGMR